VFGIINSAAYFAFTIFGVIFMGAILIGLTITDPIASLAALGLSYVLFLRPLFRRLWPLLRLLTSVLRGPGRARR
jgi:hypothetical protein